MNPNKIAAIILAATICVAFYGCGRDDFSEVKLVPDATDVKVPTTVTEFTAAIQTTTEQTSVIPETSASSESIIITESDAVMTDENQNCSDNQEITEQTGAPPAAEEIHTENIQNQQPQYETEPEQSAPSVVQNGEIEPTYINGILIVNKTYPLPESYNPGDLTTETMDAFKKMQADAWSDKQLNLWIQSGFRSYSLQESLYTRYVNRDGREAADTYSARPGHSEHQSGLAFDINIIDDSFDGTPEAVWVAENCYKYGFVIRYPKGKEDKTGYKYEPWHLRYLGVDFATELYNSGLCLEEYLGITSEYTS